MKYQVRGKRKEVRVRKYVCLGFVQVWLLLDEEACDSKKWGQYLFLIFLITDIFLNTYE